MSTRILGLRTCGYRVADIDKAKAWYSKAFQTQPYFDEPFYVGYTVGGFELGLMPDEGQTEKAENILTYWGVENIEATYKFFISQGALSHEEPHNVGGEIVVASVKDPWGNLIGFIYNPGFTIVDPPVH